MTGGANPGRNTEVQTVFDNRQNAKARLAILIPVHNDPHLLPLLAALTKLVNERVHVYVMNDLQPKPLVATLPHPIQGVILHSPQCLTIAAKVNTLMDQAQCEWLAIIESDVLPHLDWIKEVFQIMNDGDPNAVHQGGEILRKGRNLNNIIFKKELRVPLQQANLYAANDTAWFMACDQAGIPVIAHDRQALLFHDRSPFEGDMRFIQYAHDYARIALLYPHAAPLRRRILAEGYYFVRGAICLPLLLVLYAYFRIEALIESLFKGGADAP